MNKKAFTLAEVLITLGIIGVVAAMTIPTLMNNVQKHQYVTGLKKAYSSTNQAIAQLAADKGCPGDLACTDLFKLNDHTSFGDELIKYLKITKNCKLDRYCLSNSVKVNNNIAGTDEAGTYDDVFGGKYRFVTADGMVFSIQNFNDCTNNLSSGATNHLRQVCAGIFVDVNGLKAPNYFGRDIFYLYISNGKGPLLYPTGGVDENGEYWKDNNYCGDTRDNDNMCAARIMEEGWEMKY